MGKQPVAREFSGIKFWQTKLTSRAYSDSMRLGTMVFFSDMKRGRVIALNSSKDFLWKWGPQPLWAAKVRTFRSLENFKMAAEATPIFVPWNFFVEMKVISVIYQKIITGTCRSEAHVRYLVSKRAEIWRKRCFGLWFLDTEEYLEPHFSFFV